MDEMPQVPDHISAVHSELYEGSTGQESATLLSVDPAFDRRRQRIFDHRVEAQAEPSTMIACLAGVNSDLLDLELLVGESLRQNLATRANSPAEIARLEPHIGLLLRLSKQISQITQLEQRARKPREEKATP